MVLDVSNILKESLEKSGVNLRINPNSEYSLDSPLSVDVETDEKDNLVGLALTQDGINVDYYTSIPSIQWHNAKLVGHNIKFDARLLQIWGVNIGSKNIYMDTMIMSYVYNTTAPTHSLKPIAKEYVGMEWPAYDEMVKTKTENFTKFKGHCLLAMKMEAGEDFKPTPSRIKKHLNLGSLTDLPDNSDNTFVKAVLGYRTSRCTLNYHDTETVAMYCGMDVAATHRLHLKFYRLMSPEQRRILSSIEIPTLRILYDMERTGIKIDTSKMQSITVEFKKKLEDTETDIKGIVGDINLNSPKQLAPVLEKQGLRLPLTPKGNKKVSKDVLLKYADKPLVQKLLKYSEIEKLYTTYLLGFKELPVNSRIHSTFNQVRYNNQEGEWEGMATNRLSSNNPNMQNIPSKGENAKLIRSLFIPKEGYRLVVGDYSQIEYRLLAHFSQDCTLIGAFKDGKDLHEAVAKAVGTNRSAAKGINYATIYGAQAPKVAMLIKQPVREAERLLKKHEAEFPKVYQWKAAEIHKATQKGGVTTLLKRFIPLPGLKSPNMFDRMRAERQAINYIIQGSAAEIIKLAMIKCAEAGFKPILQVHDELIFESLEADSASDVTAIKSIMESVVDLSVSIDVDINAGTNWAEAK